MTTDITIDDIANGLDMIYRYCLYVGERPVAGFSGVIQMPDGEEVEFTIQPPMANTYVIAERIAKKRNVSLSTPAGETSPTSVMDLWKEAFRATNRDLRRLN